MIDQVNERAHALWYVGPHRAEIRPETLATDVGPGEVRIEALYGGISRGTERLVFTGGVPASEFARMRAPFMAGDFPFPVKYGYATVGRVVAGPDALVGRTAFALHPHQTAFTLPADRIALLDKRAQRGQDIMRARCGGLPLSLKQKQLCCAALEPPPIPLRLAAGWTGRGK